MINIFMRMTLWEEDIILIKIQEKYKDDDCKIKLMNKQCLLIKNISVISNFYVCIVHTIIRTNAEAYKVFVSESRAEDKDDPKCLCICGIRNDSNRPGIHSGKSDIQKHSNNSRQRRQSQWEPEPVRRR